MLKTHIIKAPEELVAASKDLLSVVRSTDSKNFSGDALEIMYRCLAVVADARVSKPRKRNTYSGCGCTYGNHKCGKVDGNKL